MYGIWFQLLLLQRFHINLCSLQKHFLRLHLLFAPEFQAISSDEQDLGSSSADSCFNVWGEILGASQVVLVVKNPSANAGDIRDTGSIPGSGRSPGGGHSNPLQYSCLENRMDR